MMAMQFVRAIKSNTKLRLLLFGPCSAGKTYSSLRIATGIGGRIAVIDSENGRAAKYADRFDFEVLNLPDTKPETYIAAIELAKQRGFDTLVVDSITQEWQTLRERVDHIAKARYRGNTWAAWSEGTPTHRAFIDAMKFYPGNVIATCRAKTDWLVEAQNGKNKPVRIGTKPEQKGGILYEFDLAMSLNTEHTGTFIGVHDGAEFEGRVIERPDESFGKELADWISDGAPPVAVVPDPAPSALFAPPSPTKPAEPTTKPPVTPKAKPTVLGWAAWDANKQKSFWAGANKYGLDSATIHAGFGVESMKDFSGTSNHAAICLHVLNYAVSSGLTTDDLNAALMLKQGETLASLVCGPSALTEAAAKGLVTGYIEGKQEPELPF